MKIPHTISPSSTFWEVTGVFLWYSHHSTNVALKAQFATQIWCGNYSYLYKSHIFSTFDGISAISISVGNMALKKTSLVPFTWYCLVDIVPWRGHWSHGRDLDDPENIRRVYLMFRPGKLLPLFSLSILLHKLSCSGYFICKSLSKLNEATVRLKFFPYSFS